MVTVVFHHFSSILKTYLALFGITAIPHLLEDSRCECRHLRLKIAYDLGGLGWDPWSLILGQNSWWWSLAFLGPGVVQPNRRSV